MLFAQVDIETIPEPGPSVIEWATFGVAGIGALLTFAALLVGIWQQGRQHDHEARAFLREKRLEAYSEMLMYQNNLASSITAALMLSTEEANKVMSTVEGDAQLLARFYLVATAPARAKVDELQERLRLLGSEDTRRQRHLSLTTYNDEVKALAEVSRTSFED